MLARPFVIMKCKGRTVLRPTPLVHGIYMGTRKGAMQLVEGLNARAKECEYSIGRSKIINDTPKD